MPIIIFRLTLQIIIICWSIFYYLWNLSYQWKHNFIILVSSNSFISSLLDIKSHTWPPCKLIHLLFVSYKISPHMAACVWQYSLRLQIICSIHFWLDWNGGRCLANPLFYQDKTRSFFNNLAILFQVFMVYIRPLQTLHSHRHWFCARENVVLLTSSHVTQYRNIRHI